MIVQLLTFSHHYQVFDRTGQSPGFCEKFWDSWRPQTRTYLHLYLPSIVQVISEISHCMPQQCSLMVWKNKRKRTPMTKWDKMCNLRIHIIMITSFTGKHNTRTSQRTNSFTRSRVRDPPNCIGHSLYTSKIVTSYMLHNILGNPAVYGYKFIVFLLLYIYALNSASDQCT